MPVNYQTPAPEALHPVAGIRLGVAAAGIRKKDRKDLTVIAVDAGASVAGYLRRTVFAQHRYRSVVRIWPNMATPSCVRW